MTEPTVSLAVGETKLIRRIELIFCESLAYAIESAEAVRTNTPPQFRFRLADVVSAGSALKKFV